MIRLTLLSLFITFLAVYAWRDWYKALCGLILLMAVVEHPDFPKTLFGIQGLNPWNFLLAVILLAWFAQRRREGLTWDMPRHLNVLLLLYLAVILVGFSRMLGDTGGLIEYAALTGREPPSRMGLWSEHLINTLKWVIPGLLLFDGCRDRSRFLWGLLSLLGVYFLLGVQVIKWMPLSAAISGEGLTERSAKILLNEVGYHRVNLSMMLAGASWAIFSIRTLGENRRQTLLILAASLTVLFAQSLTGGRTGYGTWVVVGLLFFLIRWRRLLFFIPVAALAILWIVPGAMERMLQGFTPESRDVNPILAERLPDYDDESGPDLYTITAGRNVAWPYVVDKIGEAPWLGHGRLAMQRTGIASFLQAEFRETFPHPHNAYLQWLLDNGWLGLVPVLLFYLLILKYSISLLRHPDNRDYIAIGGVTLALVSALLVASIGSQTFYPREGAVGMWCAIGLMLRAHIEARLKAPAASRATVPERAHFSWR